MIKLLKNPCFAYTLLWCFYFCQGILYASDSIISKMVALLILAISLKYTGKYVYSNRLDGYVKSLFFLFVVITIYGCLAYVTDGTVIKGQKSDTMVFAWFRNMYLSILPVFVYLYFAKSGYLTTSFIKKIFPVILIAVLLSYYWSYQTAIMMSYLKTGNKVEEVTNNAGYLVLSMIPMLLVFDKRRLIQYAGLLLMFVLVLLSMKRGAILICGIVSVLVVFRSLEQTNSKKRVLILLLIIVLFSLIYYFLTHYMATSDYFMARLESTKEGRSSGRDDIYSTLWNHFLNTTNVFRILFGGGIWYTTKVTWTAAHNDWLEFLLDMGIFGVLVYAGYWISFYKFSRKKTLPETSRFCVSLVFINLFLKTLFSMSLDSMTFMQSMMLGLSYYGLLESSKI